VTKHARHSTSPTGPTTEDRKGPIVLRSNRSSPIRETCDRTWTETPDLGTVFTRRACRVNWETPRIEEKQQDRLSQTDGVSVAALFQASDLRLCELAPSWPPNKSGGDGHG
jgi:hypothetical protein